MPTRLSVVRPLDGGAEQRILDEWTDSTVAHRRLAGDWLGETWFFVRRADEPAALPDLSRVTLGQRLRAALPFPTLMLRFRAVLLLRHLFSLFFQPIRFQAVFRLSGGMLAFSVT